MLWKGRRESDNVVDQRSVGPRTVGVGTLLVGAAVVYLLGGNPLAFLLENAARVATAPPPAPAAVESERKSFASVVLADTEDVWTAEFARSGRRYRAPRLILFRGLVDSACGRAARQTGPFYCPVDERVYLDLSFLDDLGRKFGARGEFAGAYVIAHEIGHHVQKLMGRNFGALERTRDSRARNRASVAIELEADCLAGVWAKLNQSLKNVLEPGDLDEALGAAAAVGDDRLEMRSQGYVVPDSFTHGSSRDRAAAFRRGFDDGRPEACAPVPGPVSGRSASINRIWRTTLEL